MVCARLHVRLLGSCLAEAHRLSDLFWVRVEDILLASVTSLPTSWSSSCDRNELRPRRKTH